MLQLFKKKGNDDMEEKRKKITMNNSGKTSTNNRVTQYILGIPTTWANKIGVTKEDRDIFISFDENKIIIEKENALEATGLEIRKRKMSVKKAGGNAGLHSITYLLSLPKGWVEQMEITSDDRDILMTLDEKSGKILIRKAENESTSSRIQQIS